MNFEKWLKWQRLVLLLLPLLLFCSFSWKTSSALEELQALNVQLHYYEISGSSIEDLREQIRRKGPVDKTGAIRDARTVWRVSWSWPEHSLDFSKTTSDYSAAVILPKWTDSSSASIELRRKWQDYFEILVQHETQHVLHAANNYDQVAQAVRNAYIKNPKLTESQARKIARQRVNLIHEMDYQFDKSTQHGLKQGAQL